jgi:hypothetical protein
MYIWHCHVESNILLSFSPGNTDFNAEDILIILQERQISKDSIEVDCPTSEKSIVKDSGSYVVSDESHGLYISDNCHVAT